MGITSEINRVARSKEIDQKVMTVTPEHAEKWLEMNIGNRRIRPSHVKHRAGEMQKGRWMLSPEPIVFSRQGRLLDGQHRLNAVLMSGCTIEASIALVQNENVFRVLDQGINRTNSDILNVPTTILAPIVWLLKTGLWIRKPTSEDVSLFMNHELFELSTYINDVIKPKDRRFKSAPFRASYIMSVHLGLCPRDQATQIYTDLSHMNMTEWTRMMQNLFHQLETAKANASKNSLANEHFMRGMYLFSEADSKKTTIRVTDKFEEAIIKQVKGSLSRIYNAGSKG